MKFFRFLFSKGFWVSLILAFLLLIGGYLYLMNYLEAYTRQNQHVVVPNVEHVPINQLPELLEKNGFRYEILDSIYDRTLKKGIVVGQKPKAGTEVKEGRKIYLTISARSAKKIKVYLDNIIHVQPRAALDYMGSMDVLVEDIELVEYQYDNMVLGLKDQNGKPLVNNQMIKAGSRLTLVVGTTSNTKIKTPDVVGKALKDAMYELLASKLSPSPAAATNYTCSTAFDSTKAKVIRQKPEAHESVKVGSSISLFYQCDSIE